MELDTFYSRLYNNQISPFEFLNYLKTLECHIGIDFEKMPKNWVSENMIPKLIDHIDSKDSVAEVKSFFESRKYSSKCLKCTEGDMVRLILTGYIENKYFGPYQYRKSKKEILEWLKTKGNAK
jgi:hypothetical protein